MWASSLAVALGLTLLAAASAQTTVSDYCDQQGQGRRLQFGGLGGLLGGGDDEPEEPCSERCPSGEGCADTVLGACESDETCKSIMETRVAGERTQLVSMITRGHITPEGQEAATASGW